MAMSQYVQQRDLTWLVASHWPPIAGSTNISRFIDWVAALQCGLDLLPEESAVFF